jgi:DNA modification methylase
VFFADRRPRSELHPTMKPVALIAAQLRNSSARGEAVLDLFAGSGSTLIACEQLGRRCYAVELDPRYCDVIRRRCQDYRDGR